MEQAFRTSFSGVWSLIRRGNRDDSWALLKELQRVDSDLVVGQVCQRLSESDCGRCVSLYDSVVCRREQLGGVQAALHQQFEEMGVGLRLKVA